MRPIFTDCQANGMPMIVMHSTSAVVTLARKMPQPNSTSQMMLNTISRNPSDPLSETISLPNGQRANPASLKAWMPNGIPMMVMHMIRPVTA